MALAGLAAGTINTVVGSGTLITFPVLLAVGYPPVLANVSNTVGLVAGLGQRRDRLPGRAGRAASPAAAARQRVRRRRASSARVRCCSLPGARVPGDRPGADRAGLRAGRRAAAAVRLAGPARPRTAGARRRRCCTSGCCGAGVYGGYFGAAQGVLLIALLGLLLDERPAAGQRRQERAGRAGQPGRRRRVHRGHRRRLGGCRPDRARCRGRRPGRRQDRPPGARAGAARAGGRWSAWSRSWCWWSTDGRPLMGDRTPGHRRRRPGARRLRGADRHGAAVAQGAGRGPVHRRGGQGDPAGPRRGLPDALDAARGEVAARDGRRRRRRSTRRSTSRTSTCWSG